MSFQCLQERIWSDIKPKGCGNSAWCEVLLALEKWRWWGLITAFLKIDLLEGTVWAPLKQLSPNTCLHLQITLNVHRLDWQASQAKYYKSGSRVYIVIMQVHTGPRVFLRSLKKFWFLSITKPARKYMENKGVIELRSSKQERVACDSHHLLLYKDWLPSKNTALLCTSGTLECFFPIASPTISTSTNERRCFRWASPLAWLLSPKMPLPSLVARDLSSTFLSSQSQDQSIKMQLLHTGAHLLGTHTSSEIAARSQILSWPWNIDLLQQKSEKTRNSIIFIHDLTQAGQLSGELVFLTPHLVFLTPHVFFWPPTLFFWPPRLVFLTPPPCFFNPSSCVGTCCATHLCGAYCDVKDTSLWLWLFPLQKRPA